MIFPDPALARASSFLARFLAASAALFLLWAFVSQLYLSTLVVTYNLLAGPETRYAVHGGSLAILYTGLVPSPLVLQLRGNDVFFMNLLVAVGLLLATPIRPLQKRLLWIVPVAALVWLTHLASLAAGEYLAVWEFVDRLPREEGRALLERVASRYPREHERVARVVFDHFRIWARPTLGLLVWFYLSAEYLGLAPADRTLEAVGRA